MDFAEGSNKRIKSPTGALIQVSSWGRVIWEKWLLSLVGNSPEMLA